MYIVHTGLHETLRHGINGDTHAKNIFNKMEY